LIIDSSALIAIMFNEPKWQELRNAIEDSDVALIPAPVLTEIRLVVSGRGRAQSAGVEKLIQTLLDKGANVVAFEHRHAEITNGARERFGKGNGRGGQLNFGDLLVYAVAKDRDEPLLCTGRDFATTDLTLHPASRLEP
jgi:ribonuclease VapC